MKQHFNRGRGATLQIEGRFENTERVRVDDGWGSADEELPPFKTTVTVEQAASGTAWQHMITEVSDNDAFYAPEVDSVVIIKVTRVTNTAASDKSTGVFGLFVDLHYQMERTGTLNKAPNFYER